jgi:hypothetical protein
VWTIEVTFARPGPRVDHSIYGQILERYVKDSMVDYQGLKKDEERLDQYLNLLNETDPEKLSRDEQFALYANAYNAYTLRLILDHYPVDSIKKIRKWWKGPWDIAFCRIGGKTLSLDDIEHGILRPRFKDPRVHAAVNCASKSCPPLWPRPFEGDRLDEQLNKAMGAFINDPGRNRLEGNTLYISKIFKWYKDDFGGNEQGILDYFLRYAEGDLREGLLDRKGEIEIDYLDYDWSLNEVE